MYTLIVVFHDVAALEVNGLTEEESSQALKDIRHSMHMATTVSIGTKAVVYAATIRYAHAYQEQ